MKIPKEKIIIILTILVNTIGIGIVFPILPFYVQKFDSSALLVALLFSAFSLFSFLSGPVIGAISDRIGRRPALILSMLSTAIGWFVFAAASNIWMLFLGRIIDGLAAGNIPVAQSYLVDIAKDDKQRTKNLGLMGAMMGVGFIVGPMIGASLGAISPSLPFWFVGWISLISVVGAYYFLPETNNVVKKKIKHKFSLNPFLPLLRATKDVKLRSRYVAWLLFAFAISFSQTIISLYLNAVFGFAAAAASTMFMVMGVIMIFNQAFGLKLFWLRYFKENQLEVWLFPIFALSFLFMSTKTLLIFSVGILLMALGQSVLRVVMSSTISKRAGEFRRGEVLGVMNSLMSLAMVIGPLLAGGLFEKMHSAPFLLAAFFDMAAFFVMLKFIGVNGVSGKEEFSLEEIEAMQKFS